MKITDKYDADDARTAISCLQQFMRNVDQNCTTCCWFRDDNKCHLAQPPATPPIKVAVKGCAQHELIPF